MKICPRCQTVFADEFNYCLEHGMTLVPVESHDSEKTLAFNEEPTLPKGNFPTAKQNKQTNPQNYSSFGRTATRTSNPLFGVLAILFGIFLILGAIFGGAFYLRRTAGGFTNPTPTPTIRVVIPTMTPFISSQKASLKVEVVGIVKGSFNRQFLKCLVTNTGDNIVSDPSVSVNFLKGDVKLKTMFGRADLKYLKPQQTIPVWVDIFDLKDYTATTAEQGFTTRVAAKDAAMLYPELVYSETKMTSKKGTSLFNYKPYTENFYTVSGIVENQKYDKVSPTVYVFYYDENKEIVGIGNTSVSELKRGEKGAFEIQKGDTHLFGTPKTFEIFSIDD